MWQVFGMTTATQRLIELQLEGESLKDLVVSARSSGQSWKSIAEEIHVRTGVIVSRESVRGWFPDILVDNEIPA
ncbi:hypothetical protein EN35_14225 [Rhodococcus qingshengii]|nr:hypothetical protein EN35_14225 [Rhodococcus qingshengii]